MSQEPSNVIPITSVPPIWRRIALGARRSERKYRETLRKKKYALHGDVKRLFKSEFFTCSEIIVPVILVRTSLRKLGFSNNAPFSAIKERALQIGLRLCPPEVAPALVVAYEGPQREEHFYIAMEPIKVMGHEAAIFGLDHGCFKVREDAIFLCDTKKDYGVEMYFHPDHEFVFVRLS